MCDNEKRRFLRSFYSFLYLNPTWRRLGPGADFKCTPHLLVTLRGLQKQRWLAFNQANLKFPQFHLVFQTNGIIIIQNSSFGRFADWCSGGNSCTFFFLGEIPESVKLCHLNFGWTWVLLSRKREHVNDKTFTALPCALQKRVSQSFFDLLSAFARNNNQTMSLFSTSWDGGNIVCSINENWVTLFEGNHTDKTEWIIIIPCCLKNQRNSTRCFPLVWKSNHAWGEGLDN